VSEAIPQPKDCFSINNNCPAPTGADCKKPTGILFFIKKFKVKCFKTSRDTGQAEKLSSLFFNARNHTLIGKGRC